jgi:hypothetical protein
MSERMPLAYPNIGSNHINFSLPLRLAHCRSMSSLSESSRSSQDATNLLEPPSSVCCPAASAPTSPAFVSGSGSQSYSSNLDPRGYPSGPSQNHRLPPPLDLNDQPRLRADSTSTESSLEASLVELEELIEVLGTPSPYTEKFFETKPETELGLQTTKPAGSPRVAPESVRRYTRFGPRWI